MSENHILWKWIRRFLALLLIALVLMWLEAQADERPRYTLISASNSLYFLNSDELPFQIIREMCWNNSDGWCDEQFANARSEELWIVVDWQSLSIGSIREIENECFWWMYRSEVGQDNQPHIAEHYWISCTLLN